MNEEVINLTSAERFHDEKPKKVYQMLEFAPEPMQVLECSRKKLHLEIGQKYPVLDKRECGMTHKVKVLNSKNQEIWVNDIYFIPAEQRLMFNEDVCEKELKGFCNLKDDKIGGFLNDFIEAAKVVPDIRTMAKEQNIPPMTDSGLLGDAVILSGANEQKEEEEKAKKRAWKRVNTVADIHEGVVKDEGNPLMNDIYKCMAAVDKIFGTQTIIDPDDVIQFVRPYVSNLGLSWEDGSLVVNGAKTKIHQEEIQAAYAGLKKVTTSKVAGQIVGKLIAKKLKKIF